MTLHNYFNLVFLKDLLHIMYLIYHNIYICIYTGEKFDGIIKNIHYSLFNIQNNEAIILNEGLDLGQI